ncbi:MAG: beta-ketoacyl-ACP synthase II [Nitrospinota bacterium]
MRRVVITGLGLVTPVGTGVRKTWEALLRGESGVGPITRFDPSDLPARIAAEVKDFDPSPYIDRKEQRRMDLFIQYALACTQMAFEDAGSSSLDADKERAGVIIGVGLGGLPSIEKYHQILLEQGPRRISPFFIPMLLANMASGQVSMNFKLKGPNSCTVTACASGNHAIGDAFKLIQRGEADLMVAGGSESVITPLAVAGFCVMRALSTRNDEPQRASRPFDKDRDGFVMGEGCGVLLLEALDRAEKRGARVYAEMAGYGLTADAHHITAPDPEGDGAARCMEMALRDAVLVPEDVDYINAHGTSTDYNDRLETVAIKRAFGEYAYKLCVSSTKSMVGHLLGGAGGAETVFTALSVYEGMLPPTVNYETPDPECDLDYVPNAAREREVRAALCNSFGFGGTNACLALKRFEG